MSGGGIAAFLVGFPTAARASLNMLDHEVFAPYQPVEVQVAVAEYAEIRLHVFALLD